MFEVFAANPHIFTAQCLVLGLFVGSFLNVVIFRLPKILDRQWREECRLVLGGEAPQTEAVFNLAYPGSRCPHCHTPIPLWQNIPVLSYLLLRGKCAQCEAKISLRYPIVEITTGIASCLVAWHLAMPEMVFAGLVFTWILICLALIDADHQLLPDQLTLPLLWCGLLVNTVGMFAPLYDAVIGAVVGYLSLWSVYWLFKLLTGKEGMGYGDFKLLAALGAWMGWQALPVIILLSAVLGIFVGSMILLSKGKDRNTAIPFGPYLALVGWINLLWGERLISTYFELIGWL